MEVEKPSSADRFIGTMAERLGAVARAATIYGEAVERDGITVIPVAKARWGFGGGVGHRKRGGDERAEDGAGGGGGVQVSPVGFIEIKNGRADFRPIRNLFTPLMIVGGISAVLFVRQLFKR